MEGKIMYWLLDYVHQEQLRQQIIQLQTELLTATTSENHEQVFPFVGRKSRAIATSIINSLTSQDGNVCDPFSGSGTFIYASLDCSRNTFLNEWEPYAYRMSTAPFRGAPTDTEIGASLRLFSQAVLPVIEQIYSTRCPNCNREIIYDALFFDRDPIEYYNPTRHGRMGKNGENIIFRKGYRCECGCKQKHFDDFDEQVLINVEKMSCAFPNVELIENSRINFTAPQFTSYNNLFSKRQKIAVVTLRDAILTLPDSTRDFFMDALISILHLAKYLDYRSPSQDNHCPPNRLKETNMFNRFIEKIKERKVYIDVQAFDITNLSMSNKDFRDFLGEMNISSISLMLTDPPYGDSAQYFEHAQRVHPFMNYSLIRDTERLSKEVVISNARERTDKRSKEQFLNDIEQLFKEAYRVIKPHGFLVLYFRPDQSDWISDLNKLKDMSRRNGFEPLITIPIDNDAPSRRVIASAAWTFKNDVCFVFLKLNDEERRWYQNDIDIDELVFLAASAAATEQGNPFVINSFNVELQAQFRKHNLMRLLGPTYSERIQHTLNRFTTRVHAQYHLTGLSPYNFINREMNAEIRLREFAPVVIEELAASGQGFTFEEYVIHLASFMDNGSREIIKRLHTANRLIPELLTRYATEDTEQGKFYLRDTQVQQDEDGSKVHLRLMDPYDFERLISDYFKKRGYVSSEVIGRTGDRGVDILATNAEGQLELIQCKRYREGNNIGSTPIQRVDSYMRSRGATKAWVVTTSDFTPEGQDEAQITGVVIMNGETLIQSLDLYYPGRYCL
jgi:restriction system protein